MTFFKILLVICSVLLSNRASTAAEKSFVQSISDKSPILDKGGKDKENIFVRCSNGHENALQAKMIWRDFVLDNTRSSSQLNTKSARTPTGDFVVGLTSLTTVTEIDFNGALTRDRYGEGECLAPKVKITINLDPIHVYIGDEFLPGSCVYNAILEHEMRHVQLYKESIPKVIQLVEGILTKRLGNKAIYAPHGQAYRLLRQEIDQFWRPLIKSELSKIEIEQQIIDSDEELASLGSVCNGEISQRFGTRVRTTPFK